MKEGQTQVDVAAPEPRPVPQASSPIIPPIVTPVQEPHVIHSDDDGDWKLVTRKSKEVARRVVYAPGSATVFHNLVEQDNGIVVTNGHYKEGPPPGGGVSLYLT